MLMTTAHLDLLKAQSGIGASAGEGKKILFVSERDALSVGVALAAVASARAETLDTVSSSLEAYGVTLETVDVAADAWDFTREALKDKGLSLGDDPHVATLASVTGINFDSVIVLGSSGTSVPVLAQSRADWADVGGADLARSVDVVVEKTRALLMPKNE